MTTLELRNQTEMVKLCLSLSDRIRILEDEVEELKHSIKSSTPLSSNNRAFRIDIKDDRKMNIYKGY